MHGFLLVLSAFGVIFTCILQLAIGLSALSGNREAGTIVYGIVIAWTTVFLVHVFSFLNTLPQ